MFQSWDLLLENEHVRGVMSSFSDGKISMRQATQILKNTEYAGKFRELIRTKGTDRARNAARKAIARRVTR